MSRCRIAVALLGFTFATAGTVFGQAKTNAPERVPDAPPVVVERIKIKGAALEGTSTRAACTRS